MKFTFRRTNPKLALLTINPYLFVIAAIVSFLTYKIGPNHLGLDVVGGWFSIITAPKLLTITLHLAFIAIMIAIILSEYTKIYSYLISKASTGLSVAFGSILGWGAFSIFSSFEYRYLAIGLYACFWFTVVFYATPKALIWLKLKHIGNTKLANLSVILTCSGLSLIAGLDMVNLLVSSYI